jgi:hypothetical protein
MRTSATTDLLRQGGVALLRWWRRWIVPSAARTRRRDGKEANALIWRAWRGDPAATAFRHRPPATRQDAHELATVMASTLIRTPGVTDDTLLPHDPGRVDVAQRAALLRLARRIELLRAVLPPPMPDGGPASEDVGLFPPGPL